MPEAPVSVIIPTYNRPESCAEAVASVLAQEPAPREVLVCDNASPPAAVSRLLELVERRPGVRVLRRAANSGGPAAPRNEALRAATAPWVAFLDDDDQWLEGKLAAQLPHAETADFVATNALRASDGTPYLRDPPRELDHAVLLRDNLVITSTVLVRVELLRAVGGFPQGARLQGVEDYAAWLEVAARGPRMLLLDEPLVRYRDEGADRFATRGTKVLDQLARLHAQRWLRRPAHPARLRAAAGALVTARRARRAAR